MRVAEDFSCTGPFEPCLAPPKPHGCEGPQVFQDFGVDQLVGHLPLDAGTCHA